MTPRWRVLFTCSSLLHTRPLWDACDDPYRVASSFAFFSGFCVPLLLRREGLGGREGGEQPERRGSQAEGKGGGTRGPGG